MEKVSREIAQEEIKRWLDSRKIFEGKRDAFKDHIEILEEAITHGVLTINEENCFEQTLLHPVGEEMTVTTLKYKPRVNRKMVAPHLKGVRAGDGDGRVLAYAAALTSQPKAILESLDPEDQRIMDSIVVFFVG